MSKEELDKKIEEDTAKAVLAENTEDVVEGKKCEEDADKVDTKDVKKGDEDKEKKDDDKKDELDTDDIKKESYQDRDQPKVQDKEPSEKEVPAGKVGDSKETPYKDGKDPEKEVPAGKVGASKEKPYLNNTAKLAKESVEKMFEGADSLSEDFMKKATTIFEAAFNMKLTEAVEKVEEDLQAEFDAKYAKLEESLAEKVDDYLDYVVTEWVDQNEVALTESIQSEIAENFLEDFKALFEKHNITIPEGKVDLLEKATAELEEAKAQINELTESVIDKNKALFENAKEKKINELTEGLAETQVEKFKALVEDIDAKDIEVFTEKVKIISESFLGKETDDKELNEGEEIVLNEDTVDADKTEKKSVKVHESVKRYVDSAKLYNGN